MAIQLLPERISLPPEPLISSARTPAGYLVQVLILAAVCAAGVYAGTQLIGTQATAPMWPPTGIAIASLLLLGPIGAHHA